MRKYRPTYKSKNRNPPEFGSRTVRIRELNINVLPVHEGPGNIIIFAQPPPLSPPPGGESGGKAG